MQTTLCSDLLMSLREAMAIYDGQREAARDHVLPVPSVKNARDKLRLTQSDFAKLLGIRIKTLQMWEKGRRRPHGPVLALCRIILTHPEQALAGLRNASLEGTASNGNPKEPDDKKSAANHVSTQ